MPNFLRLLSFYLRMEYYQFLMMIRFWNPYKTKFKLETLIEEYEEYIAAFPEFIASHQTEK